MKFLFVIALSILFISCEAEVSPIVYGKDACNFCKMTIVDKQHAAEIVTKKGKPYKYDAIECMVKELEEKKESEVSLILINDFSFPGKLIDATTATYIISENLPSPMGANLSGFASKIEADKMVEEKSGNVYSWNELKKLF